MVKFIKKKVRVKAINFSYDLATATGSQAITGVGFRPDAIILSCSQDANARGTFLGLADAVNSQCTYNDDLGINTHYGLTRCLFAGSASDRQEASLSSLDTDGFTLSWIKTGVPTGTINVIALCIKT